MDLRFFIVPFPTEGKRQKTPFRAPTIPSTKIDMSGVLSQMACKTKDGADFMKKCRFQAPILMEKCIKWSLIRWKKCDEFELFA